MIPRDAVESAEAKHVAALHGIEIQTLIPVDGGFSGACKFRVIDSWRFVRSKANSVV